LIEHRDPDATIAAHRYKRFDGGKCLACARHDSLRYVFVRLLHEHVSGRIVDPKNRQSLLPFGCTNRCNPSPSDNLYGLSRGFAFSIAGEPTGWSWTRSARLAESLSARPPLADAIIAAKGWQGGQARDDPRSTGKPWLSAAAPAAWTKSATGYQRAGGCRRKTSCFKGARIAASPPLEPKELKIVSP
jgi:hypothetical protein